VAIVGFAGISLLTMYLINYTKGVFTMYIDMEEQLEIIWNALVSYREDSISGSEYNAEWDDILTAMAHIQEELGLQEKTEESTK
jgi:hypothetical protein